MTALLVGGKRRRGHRANHGDGHETAPATSTAATNRDNDRGWDWGWLGLIGLVGLAGLMRRDRAPYDAHPGRHGDHDRGPIANNRNLPPREAASDRGGFPPLSLARPAGYLSIHASSKRQLLKMLLTLVVTFLT